jgi:hypothetical protein
MTLNQLYVQPTKESAAQHNMWWAHALISPLLPRLVLFLNPPLVFYSRVGEPGEAEDSRAHGGGPPGYGAAEGPRRAQIRRGLSPSSIPHARPDISLSELNTIDDRRSWRRLKLIPAGGSRWQPRPLLLGVHPPPPPRPAVDQAATEILPRWTERTSIVSPWS